MIRVNLLRDKTETAATSAVGDLGTRTYQEILSSKSGVKKRPLEFLSNTELNPAIKLLIMVVPVALFYFYEMQERNSAQAKVSHIMAEVNQTKTIRDEKKVLVDAINVFKAEYDARMPILNEFKLISKEKLHGIKILDQLQDLIPPQTWVTDVTLDRSQIDIAGIATSDKELTAFQKNFEDSIYFENILIYGSIESKAENGDTIHNFKMKANFSKEVLGGG